MKTKTIFQAIRQGILICDRNGRILYFNKAYGEFIGRTLPDVTGLPIQKLRPHSHVPEVLRSGQPLEGLLRKESGQEYFASIYPILEEQTVTGTISIVTAIDLSIRQEEAQQASLKERVRAFERQEIERLLDLYGHDLNGKKRTAQTLRISLSSLYAKLQMP